MPATPIPACALSPMHEQIFKQAEREAADDSNRFLYRNFAGGTLETGRPWRLTPTPANPAPSAPIRLRR